MTQDFILHTHTIGFSNHFIVHPDIYKTDFYPHAVLGGYGRMYNKDFTTAINKFLEHYNTLDEMNIKYGPYNIKVLHGMELDLFNNRRWYNGYAHAIKKLNPDYVIGACHFIEYGGKVCNIHDIKKASPDIQDKMIKTYWEKIQWIAKSGLCNFMAHLDLPARVNLGGDEKWTDIEQKTIDIIADCKIPVEINTALYKYNGQPHPLPRIMQMCADKQIPMFLSDDAHHVSQICRNFDNAKKYADSFGIKLIGLDKII